MQFVSINYRLYQLSENLKNKHYLLILYPIIGPDTRNNIVSNKKIDKNVYAKINVWEVDLIIKIKSKTSNLVFKMSAVYDNYRIMFLQIQN